MSNIPRSTDLADLAALETQHAEAARRYREQIETLRAEHAREQAAIAASAAEAKSAKRATDAAAKEADALRPNVAKLEQAVTEAEARFVAALLAAEDAARTLAKRAIEWRTSPDLRALAIAETKAGLRRTHVPREGGDEPFGRALRAAAAKLEPRHTGSPGSPRCLLFATLDEGAFASVSKLTPAECDKYIPVSERK